MDDLKGCKVAILAANGAEESEFFKPKEALEQHGAQTFVVSPEKKVIKTWLHGQWSKEYPVDIELERANPSDYDALVLPGGQMNPDNLRLHPRAIEFIKAFGKEDKPIAAICHGPWTLINAGIAKGKKVTSWPSVRIDLENAGAHWVDQEVVVDNNLVTSRKPDDIPAFTKAFIQLLDNYCGDKNKERK